ncbi:protein CASC1 [Caerostris darwini]|uniref:Protein CASC1 n=1 Tax=Caerostris darwini TaxID=1538125 RepID=A0AAV4N0S7_9ARAC|nr:protein CASC1 [Caerostris darwini]
MSISTNWPVTHEEFSVYVISDDSSAGRKDGQWNDYVYKTKEMDSLKLPVVNSFISEWEDDSSYDIEEIFRKSHLCLQGIENLKEAILTKLNYASFMLLKDAILYKNEKSQNMEYSYQEGDIALLLWANIHRAKRRHGMERIGFRFWIPPDLSSEDCAVRILQLAFEPSFRVLDLPKEISEPEENIEVDDPRESNEIILREIEENADENVEGEAPAETIVELKVEDAAVTGAQTEAVESPDTPVVEQKTSKPDLKLPDSHVDKEQQADVVDKSYREDRFTVTEDVGTSEEGKGKCLDLNEYLLIGGFLHFDLLEVPKLTISKNGFTYYYKEKPELKKIKCEPRAFDPLEKEDESVFEEEIVPEEPAAVEKMPPQPEENPDEMEEYLSEEIIRLSIGLQMP